MHKSGFVNIIGNPNVGKSTLMNALVGERLSIITSKAQTTRHRIMGIVNGDDFQIVYSDTPGILKPAYKLQESMMNFVQGAVDDADVILYVTDTIEQSDRSEGIIERVNRSGIPTIVVINKIDLTTPDKLEALAAQWQQKIPAAVVIPVSAKEKIGMTGVLNAILENLPEGPINLGTKLPKIKEGMTVSRHEAPRGQLTYMVVGDNSFNNYRVIAHVPSYKNTPTVPHMLRGNSVADAGLIIASIDPCFSCLDR